MPGHTLIAMFIIASCALLTGARAQNVYKCGNGYSQTPCPGAQVIDTADTRTAAQKQQSDLATSRDAHLADAMEKARLEQEKKDLAANTPLTKPAILRNPKNASRQKVITKIKIKKMKEPDYLVTQFPVDKKKKLAIKKIKPKKDASNI